MSLTHIISHIRAKEGYLMYGIWDNMLFLHTLNFYLSYLFVAQTQMY